MTATIQVWDRVDCPTLGQVEAYLRAHGWVVTGEVPPWRWWSRAGWSAGERVLGEMEVPDAERRDWPRLARETIEYLTTIEGRTARAVALDILSTPGTGGHDPGDEHDGGARVAECVGLRHANCVAGAAGSDPGYDEVCEIYGHRPDFVVVWRIDGRVLIGDTPRTAMPLGTALGAAAWAAATKSGCVQRKGVP